MWCRKFIGDGVLYQLRAVFRLERFQSAEHIDAAEGLLFSSPDLYNTRCRAKENQSNIIPAAEPKKTNRNVIFGLLGCGDLLVIFLVGAIFIGAFIKLGGGSHLNENSTNINSNFANNKSPVSNSKNSDSNTISVEQINSSALDEVRSLKQVGTFQQTDVKEIPASESYPSAAEAVQVTYQKGKQSVVSIVAQFPSNEAVLSDFESRIANVKNGGGKVYNNLNKRGTQESAYKYKEYYYIEVCGEAVCWRNYSSELNAVRTFATNFNSSNKKRNR